MKIRTLATAALAGLLLAPVAAYASAGGHSAAKVIVYEPVQYSDDFDFTISWTVPEGQVWTLGATGMPAGVSFADNGDNTGDFSGAVSGAPGDYDITSSATEPDDGPVHTSTSTLTILPERAVVRMAPTNPDTVKRTRSFVVGARVKDQDDGSFGDITLAEVGAFQLNRNGHITTCAAKRVAGSLQIVKGPDSYDVKCRVPAGLRRGTYDLTYSVAGDYYAGSRTSSLKITR
jgi:hypothetical protein